MSKSEFCTHQNVTRNVIDGVGIHVICNDCFEEWVE